MGLTTMLDILDDIKRNIETNDFAYLDAMITDQKAFYDARADYYDEQNEVPARITHRHKLFDFFNEHIRDLLPSDLNYLDYGCATGLVTREYLRALDVPTAERYATDISSEMVKLAESNLPDFSVLQGGAEVLQFAASLDLITTFGRVISHMSIDEIDMFFENAHTSLKPGGLLCLDAIKQLAVGERGLTEQDVVAQRVYLAYYSIKKDGSTVLDSDGRPLVGANRMFTHGDIIELAAQHQFDIVALGEISDYQDAKGRFMGLTDLAVILRKQR